MKDEPTILRVVVADDHTMFRDGLVTLLRLAGEFAVVGVAGSGAEAVTVCAGVRPDLLLVDLAMPDLDGLEVIREVRARGYCDRAVLLTMHRHPSVAADARRAGAAGYVLKEEAFDELADVLRAVAAGEPFVEPAGLLREGPEPPSLSPRERVVLRLLVGGRTNKEIADELELSVKTIETFRSRLMKKAGARNTADLVRYAVERGLS
ncbi:MAG: response regulator transcription factor [Verrucomicrobiales bacterium]|nr:response regulator transcription factor [Verrucomicrobiales bacterium]MCP5527374.1 response regulator transcription factor [Verrucomicrobiales bacterium]